MTLNMALRRAPLRLVSPAPDPVDAAIVELYDRTITAVWRLATTLYAGDTRAASAAVVDAYRDVWAAGARDQASLLHALVTGARAGHDDPVPA